MWRRSSSGDMEARRGSSMPLDRVRSPIPGPDPDGLLDGKDENLAVADPVGLGSGIDRLKGSIGQFVLHYDLDFHLGQEVDDIFGAPIQLGVALLAAETLHFGDGDARHANLVK